MYKIEYFPEMAIFTTHAFFSRRHKIECADDRLFLLYERDWVLLKFEIGRK